MNFRRQMHNLDTLRNQGGDIESFCLEIVKIGNWVKISGTCRQCMFATCGRCLRGGAISRGLGGGLPERLTASCDPSPRRPARDGSNRPGEVTVRDGESTSR